MEQFEGKGYQSLFVGCMVLNAFNIFKEECYIIG